jgi:hypothetical protein
MCACQCFFVATMAPLPEFHFTLRYDALTEDFSWFKSRSGCCYHQYSQVPMFRSLDEMEAGDRPGDHVEAILDLRNDTDTALLPMIGIGDEYFGLGASLPLHFVNFTDTDDEYIAGLHEYEEDAFLSRRHVIMQHRPGIINDTLFEGIRIREMDLGADSPLMSVGAGMQGVDALFIHIAPGTRTRLKARWWIDQSRAPAIVRNLL